VFLNEYQCYLNTSGEELDIDTSRIEDVVGHLNCATAEQWNYLSNESQKAGGLDFDYPRAELEVSIVSKESGVDVKMAEKLVQIAHRARNLKGHGLDEGISTRLLVYAGQLIAKGVDAKSACSMTMITPLTDDPDMRDTLHAAVETFLG